MQKTERSDKLRKLGLTPTIQRMAVLESLEKTRTHPTADQVLVAVRKRFPTVSRATVYNTLEALTQAGLILRITVDPAVARYDADLGPHAHFRCRLCNVVYDIAVEDKSPLGEEVAGHQIETVRTYAYGVCARCIQPGSASAEPNQKKRSKTSSSSDSPVKEGGESPDA
ncbi:Fur family transcriptional regulator [Candidatus Bipolaricaulota bacterium]